MPKSASIAYLGPEGTYSDEAAHVFADRLGADDIAFVDCPSVTEVFESVDRGRADFGVVPTENSLEGVVTSTLDNFAFNSDAQILGMTVLPIHQCLIMQPHANVHDVVRVASHPQGLAQCRRWLALNMPGVETVVCASTAESARMAMADAGVAGIGNEFAARLYGAEVREADIGDRMGNETSFALIGPANSAQVFTGDHRKTSVALRLREDKAGALLMILSEFAYASINLSMIQSRPTKQALGSYMFFVDFEGSIEDANVQTALNCLRLKLREVKVLGSYPVLG